MRGEMQLIRMEPSAARNIPWPRPAVSTQSAMERRLIVPAAARRDGETDACCTDSTMPTECLEGELSEAQEGLPGAEGLQARNPLRSAHCHVNAIQQEMQRALGYTR